jgi:hypothetical protein
MCLNAVCSDNKNVCKYKMNGCPNNKLPPVPCNPATKTAVIPAYGGNGYYCANPGCPSITGPVTGYRTLGTYGGNASDCCNPQITALCDQGNPTLGAREQHSCGDGTVFTCNGGTQGCFDNSPLYCGSGAPRPSSAGNSRGPRR